jgi:hypothetical protein
VRFDSSAHHAFKYLGAPTPTQSTSACSKRRILLAAFIAAMVIVAVVVVSKPYCGESLPWSLLSS